jgi:hypothetical protein
MSMLGCLGHRSPDRVHVEGLSPAADAIAARNDEGPTHFELETTGPPSPRLHRYSLDKLKIVYS